MEGIPQSICSFCSQLGHNAKECPTLSNPLKDGFYSGGAGGAHSHDENERFITIT